MGTRPLVALILIALVGYGATRIWPLLSGPSLSFTPQEHAVLPDGNLALVGKALHTENLWLNGAPLLIDEEGNFSTSLVLPQGNAILSLTATDRFGHEITERRTVFVP
ncbi:hypothetical protein KJ819_00645 [Patescibacteria group bacterium]|nr:hypothetical protein [Patescibacteria group bacterium]MBU1500639.1 hypothetical protein [Patescibacteria group bacterium]MBU2080408.1 hypothetical protein [Patescibacteria group bacterium]MBU2124180.1 hypothetical protein [Patescibacteria group bacterium]MBU2194369.1 hypothetical protein [Patescibacteria group bacterium]